MNRLDEYRKKHFDSPFCNTFCDYDGCILPEAFKRVKDKIYNMEVRDEDVWVASLPKAGTTWTQEMVWMILNDLNFEGGKKQLLSQRSPYLELTAMFDFELFQKKYPEDAKTIEMPPVVLDSLGFLQNKINSEPCVTIKTHLPWHLLPKQIQDGSKKPKIIYVIRNPKDVCISFFYHCQSFLGYTGDFETFCELFLADKLSYLPFWSNVLPFYNRNGTNVLFIKYEDMLTDLHSILRKVSNFLGKSFNENQIAELANHLSFENMKDNPSVNKKTSNQFMKAYHVSSKEFMRNGKSGSFKESMSPEMISKFDKWIAENTQGTGITF